MSVSRNFGPVFHREIQKIMNWTFGLTILNDNITLLQGAVNDSAVFPHPDNRSADRTAN
jgi:hypothetical protein